MKRLRIAVVGCGHICDQYGRHIQQYLDQLEIAGATDLDPTRAERFCKEYGGKPYPDFDSVINDPTVDVVLNLAVARVHFDLNARALRAGKHVYSEKPMALTHAQAVELAEIARQNGRLLGSAPITFLGEGVQTAAKFLEADKLGNYGLIPCGFGVV